MSEMRISTCFLVKLIALFLSTSLLVACGGGSSSSQEPPTAEIPEIPGIEIVQPDNIVPIDLSQSLSHEFVLGATQQYFTASLPDVTPLTVIARSTGAKARAKMFMSDQYLVSSCILGQITNTAHSCSWNTNENGALYFSIEGEAGTRVTLDILLPKQMNPAHNPLDITDKLPWSGQSNFDTWQDDEGDLHLYTNNYLYVHSLIPGKHYRIRVTSPDLRTTVWAGDCIDSGLDCVNEADTIVKSEACELINPEEGVRECERPASTNGELFFKTQPVIGTYISEYTLEITPVEDQYTGIYDGSKENPLDITNQLPYQGGWVDTFTKGFYIIKGLIPGERYEIALKRDIERFDSTAIKLQDGIKRSQRNVAVADSNGHLLVELNVSVGEFEITSNPAPKDHGTQESPVLLDASLGSIQAEVGITNSWYLINNLVPQSNYIISIKDKTHHNIPVIPNENKTYPERYMCATESCIYPTGDDTSILIKVNGANTDGLGGNMVINWKYAGSTP